MEIKVKTKLSVCKNIEIKYQFIPVCTLSPIFRSAIVTDSPFSSLTSAKDGKQPSSKYCKPYKWDELLKFFIFYSLFR